jgi:anti-anti-sigma regulatory factor
MLIEKTLKIDQISAIQHSFFDAWQKADDPIIDLSQVQDIDLAGIQFLIAILKEASLVNRGIQFTGVLTRTCKQQLVRAGLIAESCDTGENLGIQLECLI